MTKGLSDRLFPIYGCGAKNNTRHVADEYPDTLKDRDNVKKILDSLFTFCILPKKSNIFDYLHKIFFCIVKVLVKTLRSLIELMKKTILRTIITDSSIHRSFVKESENEDKVEA